MVLYKMSKEDFKLMCFHFFQTTDGKGQFGEPFYEACREFGIDPDEFIKEMESLKNDVD